MSPRGRAGNSLDFGRRDRPVRGPKVRVMAAILAVFTVGAWFVHGRGASVAPAVVGADEQVVEVRGTVPRPGFYTVSTDATVSDAIRAAGGHLSPEDPRPIDPGTTVWVEEGVARLGVMEKTLVVGVPVDINRAGTTALVALPGIGASRAEAIVADRSANGPFASVDDLTRVRGIGPATVDDLRPFVAVPE